MRGTTATPKANSAVLDLFTWPTNAMQDISASVTTDVLGNDDDMHSLFPMLSDASFDECEEEHSPLFTAMAPLDHEITPILESLNSNPEKRERLHSFHMLTPTPAKQLPNRKVVVENLSLGLDSVTTTDIKSPAVGKRRLRSQSTCWNDAEQNTFFTMFKSKWPAAQLRMPLATLVKERLAAIAAKLKTKSVEEVELFYCGIMARVQQLLALIENDIDLTDADQVRVAVWCWSKLLADDALRKDIQAIDSLTNTTRTRLAQSLQQLIVRSRRQMLKAKCSIYSYYTSSAKAVSVPPSAAPMQAAAPPAVHHPMVRKKHPGGAAEVTRKRLLSDNATDETPKKRKASALADSLVSPLSTAGKHAANVQFQTPPQSSRKKIYIKMRIVPLDKDTKARVAATGSNPKVELKLSSSKRISEVADHMAKKWAQVHQEGSAGQTELRLFPREQVAEQTGWSAADTGITCLDIWRKCGTSIKDENVVVVSYAWRPAQPRVQGQRTMPEKRLSRARSLEKATLATTEPVQTEVMQPRSSKQMSTDAYLDALMGLDPLGPDSPKEHGTPPQSTVQVKAESPAQGLQEFGKQMAFQTPQLNVNPVLATLVTTSNASAVDESPNTAKARRRIKPTLVAKHECLI
ncbi:TPA: hypothetical protein N0F65_001215 [Lagenidium giganteum]|uniref:Uncharacterized protein n=1 Tax=Lagenidium giganteum TaxID=4803 RepID=A0AAV2Z3U3_9STRA|nr:TPA: hypothetical protein N0F65_001215 [Lagenidium giganteum]